VQCSEALISLALSALGLGLLAAGTGRAADAHSPTSLGAAEATLAHPRDNSNIVHAPGSMSLHPRYDVGVAARLGPDKTRHFLAQAVDSSQGPYALGLSYAWETSTPVPDTADLPGWVLPDTDLETDETRQTTAAASLSMSWIDRRVAVGSALLRHTTQSTYVDPDVAWTANASLAVKPHPLVVLSLAGENLVPTGQDSAPLQFGGGLRLLATEFFSVEADSQVDLAGASPRMSYMGGLEAAIDDGKVPLRAGYKRDGVTGLDVITAGLGIASPEGGIDYGIQVGLGGDQLEVWQGLVIRLQLKGA